ncbi:DUF5060 domain-containing protein [uncultured Winogradskyella sp.]|uniref:DUF5060 domain-containing protein n=1 Tax=uncultured Winogradskyella sp. TaxID=395353 RepID=UPI0026399926|nr:DUF5060 domain-containing protein [uncultured Winogradskyella sp.]
MKQTYLICIALLFFLNLDSQTLSGELKKWHKVTLTFNGPTVDENDQTNPFRDYRMIVTFTGPSNQVYVIPGFFAADGDAANTSATSGNKWRAHFSPDEVGLWSYTTSFRTGADIAVSTNLTEGNAISFDNTNGTLTINATDKTGNDNRAKGRLNYVGERYLKFAETDDYFIKVGADSPENFLAYDEFDNTYDNGVTNFIKDWSPHINDWTTNDPIWQTNKGKGILGAINYLASEEMNVFSFLTMNVNGDGDDVWPWTTPTTEDRFDVSKLAQWEILFDHADKKGMFLHFKTQERENDLLLNNGNLGLERKLYYRELIARFGHHLALNWNLGEENTQSSQQRIDMAQYFFETDPYNHHIVIHTYPGEQNEVYNPLLGNASQLTGASIQTDITMVHNMVKTWVQNSENSTKTWCIASDEIGDADAGVAADFDFGGRRGSVADNRKDVREHVLYGALLAGGYGVEYYFGYNTGETDLRCENLRSRDNKWDDARIALNFFKDHIPFWEMNTSDALLDNTSAYCFSKPNDTYLVYLPSGESSNIDLGNTGNTYTVKWFNPRSGGDLQNGNITSITSNGGLKSFGNPPSDPTEDWLILITNSSGTVYNYSNGWSPSNPDGVSNFADTIIIENGNITFTDNTNCNSIIVNAGAGLTVDSGATITVSNEILLQSNATTYASLILNGTINGDVAYLRHVNSANATAQSPYNNDLIGAPLAGETFGNFRTFNPNIQSGEINGEFTFLFGPFDNTINNYINYQLSEDSEVLSAGKGFRTGSTDNGTYRFAGTVETGDVNITVTYGGASNWNLIGNPYPSYLNVQDFLNNPNNANIINQNSLAIYGYDGTASNGWTILNLATTTPSTVITPGQGFFIDTQSTGLINFSSTMRSTGNSDDFITGRTSNSNFVYLKLKLTTDTDSDFTDIYFNDSASNGLDLGYDASVWNNANSDFSLHSYLVENDNNVAIELQALHSSAVNNITVPLGVNTNANTIEFSISESTLPNEINVYLEDTETNTFTLLNNENAIVILSAALESKGRFFLRFSNESLGITNNNLDKLKVLTDQNTNEILVLGRLLNSTEINVYDTKGSLVKSKPLDLSINKQRIDVSELATGTYIVKLKNRNHTTATKVILK